MIGFSQCHNNHHCSELLQFEAEMKPYQFRIRAVFVVCIFLHSTDLIASANSCEMPMKPCPSVTSENGEVVHFILKATSTDLLWLSDLLSDIGVPEDIQSLVCVRPACQSNPCLHGGTCEENTEGFNCVCLDGYMGDRCQYAFIHTLQLLGGNTNEGRIAFTSRSNPTKYMLARQENWSSNSSDLICRYLGFQGIFATVSGVQYEASPVDVTAETATVMCLAPHAKSITDCWHSETRNGTVEESVGIVCCPVNLCNTSGYPLGLESGAVPDSAITASSCYGKSRCSRHARLNGKSAWIAGDRDQDQWIQVQFQSIYVITAIITQGKSSSSRHVTSFVVSSSLDNVRWIMEYMDVNSGQIEVFPGNYDSDSYVTNVFEVPLVAQRIRIYPNTTSVYHSMYMSGALRFELIGYGPLTHYIALLNIKRRPGCRTVRGEALGVGDGRIPDSSMTASSAMDPYSTAHHGRFNHMTTEESGGAWSPDSADKDVWIKIDLGEEFLVTGIITQGKADRIHQFVTSFHLSYSLDNTQWTYVGEKECAGNKIFAGNSNGNMPSTVLLPRPIRARYVRVHPLAYHNYVALRVEILGVKH